MTRMNFRIVIVMVVLCLAAAAGARGASAAGGAHRDLATYCARVRNDDSSLTYSPALDSSLRAAFGRLFPGATSPPPRATLQAESVMRCMKGRIYACFIGANLPCGKINVSRENPGAIAWCKANPRSAIVPMAATGHDVDYSYTCVDGRAVASAGLYALDARGFAKRLWTPLN